MKDVVIVGALRTPIGCFRGALAGHSAVELGSLVVKALIERTSVPAYAVDEVILGQVLTAGAVKRRTKNAKTFHDKCENFTFRASNETAALAAVFLFIKWDHFGYG